MDAKKVKVTASVFSEAVYFRREDRFGKEPLGMTSFFQHPV